MKTPAAPDLTNLIVAAFGLIAGLAFGFGLRLSAISVGDFLGFLGALLGAAVTVTGAKLLTDYARREDVRNDKRFLADSLAELHSAVSRMRDFDAAPLASGATSPVRAGLIALHGRVEAAVNLLAVAQERVNLREFSAVAALLRVRRLLDRDRDMWAAEASIIRGAAVTPGILQVHVSKLRQSAAELTREVEAAAASLDGKKSR